MFERGKKDKPDDRGADNPIEDYDLVPIGGGPDIPPRPRASGHSEVAVIGRSIRIDGDLQGEEDLRIEGDVRGTVQLRNNTLTIGNEGKISANVYAKSVTVEGLMEGDLYASERVGIRENARVTGNITAPRVSLDDGAKFKGSIEMDPAAVEKALGLRTGAAPAVSEAPASKASRPKGPTGAEKAASAASNGGARNEPVL